MCVYYYYFYTHTYISTKIKNNDIKFLLPEQPNYTTSSTPFRYIYISVYTRTHTVNDGLCPDDVKQAVRLWEVCVRRRINIIISALKSR